MMQIEAVWVPFEVARRIIGEGLGLGRPIDYATLRKLISDGALQSKRVGTGGRSRQGRIYVSIDSLRAYLADAA